LPQLNDLAELLEISPENWRALCAASGYPEGATPKNVNAELIHDLMGRGGEFPPELVESLEIIHRLGTADGSELLRQMAEGLAVTLERAANEGPRDFAARLCAARKRDSNIQKVLDFANAAIFARGPSRTYREFAGKEARPAVSPGRLCEPLQQAMSSWCRDTGRSPYCRVRLYEKGDELHFYVTHGHSLESPSVLNGDKHEVLKFRRVQSDLVRFNGRTGRLSVSCASVHLVHVLREFFGTVLFGDAGFFSTGTVMSLDVLQLQGRGALDKHHVNQIANVRLVRAHLELADGSSVTTRAGSSGDCFDSLDAQGASLGIGRLTKATLKITFNGKRGVRTVQLTLPDKFGITQDETAPWIYSYLEQVGIRRAPPPRHDDLWAMATGAFSVDEWQGALGTESFDRLRKAGALVATPLSRIVSANGEALQVQEVEGQDDFVGVNEDLEYARPLSASEVEGYTLHVPSYVSMLAGVLELYGGPPICDGEGLVALGVKRFGQKAVTVFLQIRPPPSPQSVDMRLEDERRAGREFVVLVPHGRLPVGGTRRVGFTWRGLDAHEVVRAIIFEMGWQRELSANLFAPPGAQLIIDERLAKVWIEGLEVPLKPDTHPYKYLLALARNRGQPVPKETIHVVLSGVGFVEDAVRQAKKQLKSVIEGTFAKAGREACFDLWFPPVRNQHRTSLQVFFAGVAEDEPEVASVG
jgi:hypothetical protein